MAVMIGIDPHKGSHTAVALDDDEQPLGELRVRSAAGQVERLVQWATPFTERTWAIEGAGGLGYLLAQQLVAAGERVVDVQPKLAARVRLLATGSSNKNDPNDARSVAVAALRATVPEVRAEDHVKVMKVWAKRHRDLSSHRTRIACRLHAVLCELTPGGFAGEISAAQATRLLDELEPAGAVAAARHAVASELVADLRRLDDQLRDTKQRITAAVKASKTTLTAAVRGRTDRRRHDHRRRRRHRPLPEPGPVRRLQRHRTDRGLLRRAATQGVPPVTTRQPSTQPRHPHGRRHPDPPSPQPRPRLLRPQDRRRPQRQRSDPGAQAAHQRRRLQAAPRRRRPGRDNTPAGPGGHTGNDSVASAAGSHPEHRLFGQATPEPDTTLRPARARTRQAQPTEAPRVRDCSCYWVTALACRGGLTVVVGLGSAGVV